MALVDIGTKDKKPRGKYRDSKQLYQVTEGFIEFHEKSAERFCNCKNSKLQIIEEKGKNGRIKHRFVCSICHGKYYKYRDFSYLALILGMKGSGKTTFALIVADMIYRIDPNREILLWQCPDSLIDALYEVNYCIRHETVCERALGLMEWSNSTPKYEVKKGKNKVQASFQKNEEVHRICQFNDKKTCEDCKSCKYYKNGLRQFRKITKLTEVTFNSILIIDEGIINVNAKQALTKAMRNWDKLLMVLRHKRCILFCLFQRPEIIKSMRTTAEMTMYKRQSKSLIDEEKVDKFMKEHRDILEKLSKGKTVVKSQHTLFDKTGIIETKVPEWYNDDISMSYEDETDFVDDKADDRKSMDLAHTMAEWLREQHITIDKTNERIGAKGILRVQFPDATNKELQLAIEQYYALQLREGNARDNALADENGIMNPELANNPEMQELAQLDSTISETEREIYHLYVTEQRTMRDFDAPPYNVDFRRVTEIIQRVGREIEHRLAEKSKLLRELTDGGKSGETTERRIKKESWEDGGYAVRTVGSGGVRGDVPSPDLLEITSNGKIRAVQSKERNFDKTDNYDLPLTSVDTELAVINRIRKIAQSTVITCPYCMEKIKGEKVGGIIQPEGAFLYVANKSNPSEPVLKERIKIEDNKKTLRIAWKRAGCRPLHEIS